jgi:DNA-binding NtrC family response regulator
MLVHWFLERYAEGEAVQVKSAAMKSLMQYDWPGNVRELENCIERAVALGSRQIIDLSDLPPALAVEMGPEIKDAKQDAHFTASESGSTSTDLESLERAAIQRVFEQVKGDKVLAGKMLGISRATLYRKLKRYNIGLAPLPPLNGERHALQ